MAVSSKQLGSSGEYEGDAVAIARAQWDGSSSGSPTRKIVIGYIRVLGDVQVGGGPNCGAEVSRAICNDELHTHFLCSFPSYESNNLGVTVHPWVVAACPTSTQGPRDIRAYREVRCGGTVYLTPPQGLPIVVGSRSRVSFREEEQRIHAWGDEQARLLTEQHEAGRESDSRFVASSALLYLPMCEPTEKYELFHANYSQIAAAVGVRPGPASRVITITTNNGGLAAVGRLGQVIDAMDRFSAQVTNVGACEIIPRNQVYPQKDVVTFPSVAFCRNPDGSNMEIDPLEVAAVQAQQNRSIPDGQSEGYSLCMSPHHPDVSWGAFTGQRDTEGRFQMRADPRLAAVQDRSSNPNSPRMPSMRLTSAQNTPRKQSFLTIEVSPEMTEQQQQQLLERVQDTLRQNTATTLRAALMQQQLAATSQQSPSTNSANLQAVLQADAQNPRGSAAAAVSQMSDLLAPANSDGGPTQDPHTLNVVNAGPHPSSTPVKRRVSLREFQEQMHPPQDEDDEVPILSVESLTFPEPPQPTRVTNTADLDETILAGNASPEALPTPAPPAPSNQGAQDSNPGTTEAAEPSTSAPTTVQGGVTNGEAGPQPSTSDGRLVGTALCIKVGENPHIDDAVVTIERGGEFCEEFWNQPLFNPNEQPVLTEAEQAEVDSRLEDLKGNLEALVRQGREVSTFFWNSGVQMGGNRRAVFTMSGTRMISKTLGTMNWDFSWGSHQMGRSLAMLECRAREQCRLMTQPRLTRALKEIEKIRAERIQMGQPTQPPPASQGNSQGGGTSAGAPTSYATVPRPSNPFVSPRPGTPSQFDTQDQAPPAPATTKPAPRTRAPTPRPSQQQQQQPQQRPQQQPQQRGPPPPRRSAPKAKQAPSSEIDFLAQWKLQLGAPGAGVPQTPKSRGQAAPSTSKAAAVKPPSASQTPAPKSRNTTPQAKPIFNTKAFHPSGSASKIQTIQSSSSATKAPAHEEQDLDDLSTKANAGSFVQVGMEVDESCLLYTSPSPRDS